MTEHLSKKKSNDKKERLKRKPNAFTFLASVSLVLIATNSSVGFAQELKKVDQALTAQSKTHDSEPSGKTTLQWRQSTTAFQEASAVNFPAYSSCHAIPEPDPSLMNNPFNDGVIRAWSDSSAMQGKNAHLSGNVIIRHGEAHIQTGKFVADGENQRYYTEGTLLFASPSFIAQAEQLNYNGSTGKSTIANSQFYLYANRANGNAQLIELDQNQILTLNQADFSTCPENDRSWVFNADTIIIDKEKGWGKAYNSTIRVADIPIFYLPYMTFPVDDRRKTGILPPSFSNSSRNGIDISAPYYLNLAPNYDMTLTPRLISKRGVGLGSEFRYMLDAHQGDIELNYLPSDNLASNNSQISSNNRWRYHLHHKSQFSPGWSGVINAQKVSDDAYFQDFGGSLGKTNQAVLSQNLYLQYLDQDWHFKAQYHDWQLLNSPNQRYNISPRFELTRYFYGNGYYANIRSEVTRFEQTQATNTPTANRLHLEPTVGWNFERLYGFIRPQISYSLTQYQQKDLLGDTQTIDRDLPTVSIDSGLFFDRAWMINSKGKEQAFTQTLEPRLFYLYTPYQDQSNIGNFDTNLPSFNFTQLFSRNRFAGIDRIGDTSQISAALTSRLLDSEGKERAALTLGRISYLKDRKVQLAHSTPPETLKQSGLLAEVNWRWTDQLEIKGAVDWDDQEKTTSSGTFLLHYEPKENHIINLGHRFRRNLNRKFEEAEVSFAWPIKENWRVLGRYSRDLSESRTNESFFGLEYESCCWAVRLVNRRYLNIQLDNQGELLANQGNLHNSGVFVQFVLKGIGSLRGSTTEFLEESIYGYQDKLGK